MKGRMITWSVLSFFTLLSVIFFRQYFFARQVPLPFNLLVSFYSPWKYERWAGYDAGVPNKPLGSDNLKLFYPFKKIAIEELRGGKIPLWNPYFFSGNVFHATYQSALFYPLNVVYFLFPLVDAWSILVIIQPILAGWFTYLFLRSIKLSGFSSLFGAIGFAFSGWMIAHWEEVLVIEHTIVWMPLSLYGSTIIWKTSQQNKGFIILLLSLVFSILAGFPQMVVYLFVTVVSWNTYLWFLDKKDTHRTSRLRVVIGAMVLSIILTAFQWMPALESYILAPRVIVDSSYLFKTFLTPLYYLVTVIAPDFWGNPGTYNYFSDIVYLQERTIFVGIPIFIFAVYEILRKTKHYERFWKYATLAAMSFGFALPTSWLWYILRVPILSVAMPVRIFVLSTFGLCVVGAFGIERYMKVGKLRTLIRPLIPIGITLVLLWIIVLFTVSLIRVYPLMESLCKDGAFPWCRLILDSKIKEIVVSYATISLRNLVVPSALFVSTVLVLRWVSYRRNIFYALMCGLTLFGSYHFAQKLLYYSDRRFEYPLTEPVAKLKELAGHDRVWSYGDAYVVRNILAYYRIYSPEGYEALYSHRYGTLLNTIGTNGVITDRIHRNDATLSETGQYEPMTNNPIRLRLMSLLGVKYILEYKDEKADQVLPPSKRFPEDLFSIAWENEQWRIWEYRNALPRAILIHNVILEQDPRKIVNRLLDHQTNLRTSIVTEDQVAYVSTVDRSHEETVSIIKYEPSEVLLSVVAKTEGLLFLSDTFYPGWKATVDGVESKIYRANFVFRAVRVAEGTHEVKFVYDPLSWKIGIYLSGMGLAALVIFVSIKNRNYG